MVHGFYFCDCTFFEKMKKGQKNENAIYPFFEINRIIFLNEGLNYILVYCNPQYKYRHDPDFVVFFNKNKSPPILWSYF